MNYNGIKDVQSGASGSFKAFYNSNNSANKNVTFRMADGGSTVTIPITPSTILPVQGYDVASADAGVYGLY